MKSIYFTVVTIFLLIGTMGVVFAEDSNSTGAINFTSLNCENASKIVVDYLNAQTNNGVSYDSCADLGQMFQINVTYKGQEIPVYTTKDGVYFVQSVILIGQVGSMVDGETAERAVINYLNSNVTKGVIYESSKDMGSLYQIIVNYNNQKIPIYVTKDGAYFVQSAVNMSLKNSNVPNSSKQSTGVPKTDKPVVEVFVFSYCPYGLQFEKALFPVYDLLKNKADINIVYIGAMHGEFEHVESLRQIAILNLYGKDGLFSYLKEFDSNNNIALCNGNVECLDKYLPLIYVKLAMNQSDIEAYMNNNSEVGYQDDVSESSQLGIQGSPTFVINGVQVDTSRDPEALKTAICNAFTIAPSECSMVLSHDSPNPGFNSVTSNSGSTSVPVANCNNNNNNNNQNNNYSNEPIKYPKINETKCNGCSLDTKCYSFGFRKDGNYCDDNSTNFTIQKQPNSGCQNNFECDSNLCVNNQCVSGSLWQKIMNWFGKLFGGK